MENIDREEIAALATAMNDAIKSNSDLIIKIRNESNSHFIENASKIMALIELLDLSGEQILKLKSLSDHHAKELRTLLPATPLMK